MGAHARSLAWFPPEVTLETGAPSRYPPGSSPAVRQHSRFLTKDDDLPRSPLNRFGKGDTSYGVICHEGDQLLDARVVLVPHL
jgi:hypothetical protein